MLSLFRTNQLVANVLFIFYAAICRMSSYFTGLEGELSNPGILAEYLYSFTAAKPFLSNSLSILLVFLQAMLINVIVAKHRMANEVTMFPGLFYILLCSSIPEFLAFSPPLLANTFYIIALFQIFKTGETDITPQRTFVEDYLAYIVWSGGSNAVEVPFATDTFIIRGGKIIRQTFAGIINPIETVEEE